MSSVDPTQPFVGFSSPNYTQVPDELFDQLMPTLSDAELRVLLYIIRRTYGFKRQADDISLSQMVSGITTKDGKVLDTGTGLSKATVARGLKGLREKGVILSVRNRSTSRGDEPTTYRLRMKDPAAELSRTSPVSQQRDTPRVLAVRQGVSQPQDTQHTVQQHTVFEMSKEENPRQDREDDQTAHTQPKVHQTRSSSGLESVSATLARRARPVVSRDDNSAIAVAIEHMASELGDSARLKSSLTRALRLFQNSGLHRDVFIDAMHQAKGEVRDRRRNPGRAPLPRNQMAYFFAILEDRLGAKSTKKAASE